MEKSGLVIRDRRPGDLPAIVEIGNDSNPPDAHRTLEEAKRGEALFDQSSNPVRLIAEIDGQPVGFGILQRDFFEHDRAQQNGRTARRAGNSGSMSMCCKRLELRATEMECQEL